jgi:O-antigen/teichoic acid export membrane protein
MDVQMSAEGLFSKIKEAAGHTIVYGLGSVSQAVLGYVLIPFYTRYYTTEIYGVLSLLTLSSTIAGSIFYLGTSSALSRSFYDYADERERKLVVSTAFYISLSGAGLQILLGFLLRNAISLFLFRSTLYSTHVALILATSALTFLANLFFMVLRFERKSKHVVAINFLSLLLTSGLILYLLVQLELGVMAPVLGGFISQAVVLGILCYVSRKYIAPGFLPREAVLQLKFGIPSVLVGLGYYTLDWVDRLLINQYGSLSDVGVYSLGYKLGIFIHTLFIIPFSQIWTPMRMEYRNDQDAEELHKLILTYYFSIGLFLTILVSAYSKELIMFLAERREYVAGYAVVAPVMLGHLIYGAVNIIDSGIIFERKVMYHVYIFWFTVLVNLGLNYLLIPRFGYLAAAYTTLLSYVILALLVFVVSSRLHKIRVEGGRLLKVFGLGLAVLALGSIVSSDNSVLSLWLRALLIVLFLIIFYFNILSKREKDRINSLLRKWIARGGSIIPFKS